MPDNGSQLHGHLSQMAKSITIFFPFIAPPLINAPLFAPQNNDLRKDEVAKKTLKIEKLHLFQCL